MGFKGSWNKRNRLIEDLDTFLKLYKKNPEDIQKGACCTAHTRALSKGP